MTLREEIKLQKAAGHVNRVCLPITQLEDLIARAEKWDRLPQILKDAAKKMEATK